MQPPAGSQVSWVPAQRTRSGQESPDPVAIPPAPKRRRLRTVLAIVAGLLAVLGVAGAAIAYVAYDRYTSPDQSAPDITVNNYLQAYMADRNDIRAKPLACGDTSKLAELAALRADLVEREKRFDTTFHVKWGKLDPHEEGDRAEVLVDLVLSTWVNDLIQSERQSWRFVTERDGAWRVCEASRVT
ncbi:hypothetical protein BDK92_3963 [Micromonospora pisi]|uniref:Uncharacterized protein n=1 Tax=Micromonospora pisi TaxID=589240 RepID=A0A495JM30_9ACTN|nr:hypothetical protein [Micromonospora pisi]RKR89608.1 hypothetical protein BDK92_3963 [Micromonospora pisi]